MIYIKKKKKKEILWNKNVEFIYVTHKIAFSGTKNGNIWEKDEEIWAVKDHRVSNSAMKLFVGGRS